MSKSGKGGGEWCFGVSPIDFSSKHPKRVPSKHKKHSPRLEYQSQTGQKAEAEATTFGAWAEELALEASVPFVFQFADQNLRQRIESVLGATNSNHFCFPPGNH